MQTQKICNAFTLDVEDYYHVSAFEKVISPAQWAALPSRVERNTDVILEMLNKNNIRGTFFVLGWVAERNPGMVRRIADSGHEVASHGYSHRLVYNQSQAVFREETIRSKKLLEDTIGKPVIGYRAASYSITRKSLWALQVLAELGFSYDSSVFPVKHDRYGIYSAPRFPHRLTLESGAAIMEFPLSTSKVAGLNLPVAGGGYFRLFPYFLTRTGLGKINNQEQRPFIFYLHPWEVDVHQPRIKASLLSRFRHYQNLDTCQLKLDRLLKDFSFTTVRGVLESESARNAIATVDIAQYTEGAR
ncbi:MAG: XrtA system polysaccharide deacetylase [Pseudomonadota bacterium]